MAFPLEIQSISELSRLDLHRMTSYELHTGIIKIRTAKRAKELERIQSKKYEDFIEFAFMIQVFLAGSFVTAMWYA